MHDVVKNTSPEDVIAAARRCAARRAERIDMVVAATLLVLLIFGWAIRLAPIEQWPRGDFRILAETRHT
ncbi:MAG: hypothetical protein K2X43_17370 [Hyphomonadaceae bacterium]|jgi:hypothetical protein|nr:hypothetical protein [Hyphomonadaceae bacterium]